MIRNVWETKSRTFYARLLLCTTILSSCLFCWAFLQITISFAFLADFRVVSVSPSYLEALTILLKSSWTSHEVSWLLTQFTVGCKVVFQDPVFSFFGGFRDIPHESWWSPDCWKSLMWWTSCYRCFGDVRGVFLIYIIWQSEITGRHTETGSEMVRVFFLRINDILVTYGLASLYLDICVVLKARNCIIFILIF